MKHYFRIKRETVLRLLPMNIEKISPSNFSPKVVFLKHSNVLIFPKQCFVLFLIIQKRNTRNTFEEVFIDHQRCLKGFN